MKSLLSASLMHFKSKEAEAAAVLEAYLNKAVAVADHSNLVGEVNEWVSKLTEARDNIETLESLISVISRQMQSPPSTSTTSDVSQQEG